MFFSTAEDMVKEVWLPVPGQQADVHHAVGADSVYRHKGHAALLRPGGHRPNGQRHSTV